ncbi:hypothetical protein E1294_02965 [Nonomuraea diastatica]|uniref:B12-binding domain-containing protein n=1 Tax=Nonomuraea diastatica TaxID=1848329 RepID=A0A4R4X5G8_9ACTN|nr:hypothetical protein E1294_02965 [Nonomuraea diastatica]
MRVALAAMPWQPINRPSLPIGILHELLRTRRPDIEVNEFHGGIRWVEFLMKDSGGDLGPKAVTDIAEYGVLHGLGDWVFAGCLHDDPAWRDAEFRAYAEARGLDVDAVLRMRPHAAGFIDVAVNEVLAGEPHVVGFTSTFMQNAASLALARRLKHLRPELLVVFGGANCDGIMGHALHRNHPFVDYVVRGEGEEVFPLPPRPRPGGRGPGRSARCVLVERRRVDRQPAHEPLSAARRHPAARLPRMAGGVRDVARTRARPPATRHGRVARLLVGRETPVHVLRPQRLHDRIPVKARRPFPGRAVHAGQAASDPGRAARRQHPRHELFPHGPARHGGPGMGPARPLRDQIEYPHRLPQRSRLPAGQGHARPGGRSPDDHRRRGAGLGVHPLPAPAETARPRGGRARRRRRADRRAAGAQVRRPRRHPAEPDAPLAGPRHVGLSPARSAPPVSGVDRGPVPPLGLPHHRVHAAVEPETELVGLAVDVTILGWRNRSCSRSRRTSVWPSTSSGL